MIDSLNDEKKDLSSRCDAYFNEKIQMESNLNECKGELHVCEFNNKELQLCVQSYKIELESIKSQLDESSQLQSVLLNEERNNFSDEKKKYEEDIVTRSECEDEEIVSLMNIVKSRKNETMLLNEQVNQKQETIKCLENKLSRESVVLSEIISHNRKLILEVEELKKRNSQLENNILELSDSPNKNEFNKLREALKSCKLELGSTQVECTYKDKEIETLRKDVIFLSKKSNIYREELRKVRKENMDTIRTLDEQNKGETAMLCNEMSGKYVSQACYGGIVEHLCLNIKEYEIKSLKKEIKEQKDHEESILSAYKKWKKIAKAKEEELRELQLKYNQS